MRVPHEMGVLCGSAISFFAIIMEIFRRIPSSLLLRRSLMWRHAPMVFSATFSQLDQRHTSGGMQYHQIRGGIGGDESLGPEFKPRPHRHKQLCVGELAEDLWRRLKDVRTGPRGNENLYIYPLTAHISDHIGQRKDAGRHSDLLIGDC
jgi:hypothetical protein